LNICLEDTDFNSLTFCLMANTGDRNSCVFLPIVVGVKIFPAVGHIVRAELVVVSDIPNCSVASPASVQNAWAYNPLGVAKNRIAVSRWSEVPTLVVHVIRIFVAHQTSFVVKAAEALRLMFCCSSCAGNVNSRAI